MTLLVLCASVFNDIIETSCSPLLLRGSRRFRHVITGSGAGFVTAIGNVDADLTVTAVHPCIARAIADLILRSELIVNIHETARKILDFQREKRLAAGLFGKFLEGF